MIRKALRPLSAIILAFVLCTPVFPSYASAASGHGSGSSSGTKSGYHYSCEWVITSAKAYGKVTCNNAHDVSVFLNVYYLEGGTYKTATPYTVSEPGTVAACTWIAGSGRVIQDDYRTNVTFNCESVEVP